MKKNNYRYVVARIFIVAIVYLQILLCIFSCESCRHYEHKEVYSFVNHPNYLAYKQYHCKDCGYFNGYNNYIYEMPDKTPYLDLIRELVDCDVLIDGEFYTIKAIVNNNYSLSSVRCKLEDENVIVYFSIYLKDEYKNNIKLLKSGDEITICGKFNSVTLEWIDCELINEQ